MRKMTTSMRSSAADLRDERVAVNPMHGTRGRLTSLIPRAYLEDAHLYDRRTQAFQGFRRAIVDALRPHPGDVVLDVGCGTGLCFPMVLEKVGTSGRVVGIDESPEMIAVARERVARMGWNNVAIVQSSVTEVTIPIVADAALFCAVHDILRSPRALRKVVKLLRPGAWIAAGGGKWAPPWMVALNLQVQAVHAPYVRSFEGFHRPWSHLERLVANLDVRELAGGGGFVATGQVPLERAAGDDRPDRAARPGRAAGPGRPTTSPIKA